jgi:hypothetical protein
MAALQKTERLKRVVMPIAYLLRSARDRGLRRTGFGQEPSLAIGLKMSGHDGRAAFRRQRIQPARGARPAGGNGLK